jgi:hypothetical protein
MQDIQLPDGVIRQKTTDAPLLSPKEKRQHAKAEKQKRKSFVSEEKQRAKEEAKQKAKEEKESKQKAQQEAKQKAKEDKESKQKAKQEGKQRRRWSFNKGEKQGEEEEAGNTDELATKLARRRQLNNENEADFTEPAGATKTWDVEADLSNSPVNVKAAGDDLMQTKVEDATKTWDVNSVSSYCTI